MNLCGIVFSPNVQLRDLYEVNLRAYLNAELLIVESDDEFLACLRKHKKDLKFILYFASDFHQQPKDTLSHLDLLIEKELNRSLVRIMLGHYEHELPEGFLHYERAYDLKSVIRKLAGLYSISAEQMAALKVEDYFAVPTSLIVWCQKAEFELFSKNDRGEFISLLGPGQDIQSMENLAQLSTLKTIYVEKAKRLKLVSMTSEFILSEFEKEDLSQREKTSLASQAQQVLIDKMFEKNEINDEMKQISDLCIKASRDVLKENPQLKELFKLIFQSKEDYLYSHGILASFFARHVIDHMNWGNEEQKDKVTFAFFFHDLYLAPILNNYPDITNEEDLIFDERLSDKEKEEVLDHALKASEFIKKYPKCPIGVDQIILQHHGTRSGKGFSQSFSNDISPLAKVMAISEDAASHAFKRKKANLKPLVNKESLETLLREKYRPDTYQKLIDSLMQGDFH